MEIKDCQIGLYEERPTAETLENAKFFLYGSTWGEPKGKVYHELRSFLIMSANRIPFNAEIYAAWLTHELIDNYYSSNRKAVEQAKRDLDTSVAKRDLNAVQRHISDLNYREPFLSKDYSRYHQYKVNFSFKNDVEYFYAILKGYLDIYKIKDGIELLETEELKVRNV